MANSQKHTVHIALKQQTYTKMLYNIKHVKPSLFAVCKRFNKLACKQNMDNIHDLACSLYCEGSEPLTLPGELSSQS